MASNRTDDDKSHKAAEFTALEVKFDQLISFQTSSCLQS